MIAKAKAISHGINDIRYITGESQHKKHPEKRQPIAHTCCTTLTRMPNSANQQCDTPIWLFAAPVVF